MEKNIFPKVTQNNVALKKLVVNYKTTILRKVVSEKSLEIEIVNSFCMGIYSLFETSIL